VKMPLAVDGSTQIGTASLGPSKRVASAARNS
jgi:hypothetical protein